MKCHLRVKCKNFNENSDTCNYYYSDYNYRCFDKQEEKK